jgi:hypothetical protein
MDQRSMSTKPPTAIVMMNMGGPSTQEEVHPFLYNLFTDRQIMQMPMQQTIGAWLAPFPCSAESDYPLRTAKQLTRSVRCQDCKTPLAQDP